MKVPSLNPYTAPQIVCPNCSSIISPEVRQANNKKVTEIVYVCVNEERDCGWILTLSAQHILGDIMRLKPEEIEKRRKEAEALADFSRQREAAISNLIALLPEIKALADLRHEVLDDEAARKQQLQEPEPEPEGEEEGEEVEERN